VIRAFLIGLILIGSGFGLSAYIQSQLDSGIASSLIIDSFSSSSYSNWFSNAKLPPLYTNIYIWNVTNPEEVKKGAKPNLVECGPYSYRKLKTRFRVSFPNNGNLRSFKTQESYFFF